MNGPLAVFILLSTSYRVRAAPASQQFQSQEYQTQSLYPVYNLQHQSLPINSYSNQLFHSAYLQNPLPAVNPLPFNSSELKQIKTDYQAALEKIKKENEENRAAIKLDQKVDADKPVALANQGSIVNPVSPLIAAGKTVGAPAFGHHAVDPIFGPEIGSKYEIHYSPENLSSFSDFSAYAGYPVQHAAFPVQPAFPAYSAFPVFSQYPNYGSSNPFLGVGTTSLNGNKINSIPSNSQIPGSSIGGVPNYPTAEPGPSSESSTEAVNETSSESSVGAPPSIDGPKPSSRAFSAKKVPAKTTIRKA